MTTTDSRELTKELLLRSGINELYHDLSLEDYKGDTRAFGFVKEYIDHIHTFKQQGIGISCHGEPGTGKTFLMVEVLKAAMITAKPNRIYYTARQTSLGEIVHYFTNTWYDKSAISKFERDLIDVDFLLIDDVEKTYISNNSKVLIVAALDKVIRTRVSRLRPILLTSNEEPQTLEIMFGKAISSLLAGHCRSIPFLGKDYRKENKAAMKWKEVVLNVP